MTKDPSYNYSYTPTVDHRESNLYREEYYSSTDTRIYFDDEEQTEIGFIQYDLQEQLKPVYGYNSRTFDDVVIGNRIVTGSFTVPIKNKEPQAFDATQLSTYMGKENVSSNIDTYNNKEDENLYNVDWFGTTARNIDKHNTSNINPEYLTKLISLGYDVTSNASEAQYKKALQEFQKNHDESPTGILNENLKEEIDNEVNKLTYTSINLDGEYGYDDIALSKGKVLLSGDGLIVEKYQMDNGEVWRILDSNGVIHYLKGTAA